ncbi:MAG: ABC transporter permease subunit [Gemmataceae bacterium]|nr:ABC transporter permease subunit [Gemmataceae bacterium]
MGEPLRHSSLIVHPSSFTAFLALVGLAFRRQWRVRGVGWVGLALLGLTAGVVALVTAGPAGWGLEGQRVRRTGVTYRAYAAQLTPEGRYAALTAPPEELPPRPVHPLETPSPLDPTREGLRSLLLSVPHAVLSSDRFRADWAFLNFTRWVVIGAYLGFVLPLFTLAYASGALGTEREARTLVWLLTRPIPRWAVYLGTLLGTLPWCLVFAGGGFAGVCLAGGGPGREALRVFWPAALAGAVAFAAIFHLVGAVFRRPVVVGLVYVFFFEYLVAALPGSLKLLSVTFYARSLMYNEALAAGFPADRLDLSQPVSAATAWAVLAVVTAAATGLGMWLFTRAEYRDDV